MTDAERVRALRPYLKHFSSCAFMERGAACDCGLYRLLGMSVTREEPASEVEDRY
jgi:hypothetical protein